jgi:hypothetical protein
VAGIVSFLVGLGLAVYALVVRLILVQPISGRPLLTLVPFFLIIVGLIFISFGLQFEMMMRMYHESQKKTIYVVRTALDRTEPDEPAA